MSLIGPFIAHSKTRVYSAAMARITGKLLILLALLTMPAGMSWVGASASSGGHEAVMDMAHCPDSAPAADLEPGIAPCNMACAAALPAFGAPVEAEVAAPDCPLAVAEIGRLNGLEPDIATPPPRLS